MSRPIPRARRLLALAALLAAACDQAGSPLDPGAPLLSRDARPLRIVVEGHANPDFGQGPCRVANTERGTGHGTHLGRLTWTSSEVANFCVDPADPQRALVTGAVTFVAANGDALHARYVTTLAADFAHGTLAASGPFTITGGTGRFAGATGGGTLTARGDLAAPFGVVATFAGEIGY